MSIKVRFDRHDFDLRRIKEQPYKNSKYLLTIWGHYYYQKYEKNNTITIIFLISNHLPDFWSSSIRSRICIVKCFDFFITKIFNFYPKNVISLHRKKCSITPASFIIMFRFLRIFCGFTLRRKSTESLKTWINNDLTHP